MYVKVKRKKDTIFLHIDLNETILEVKAKLQELVDKVGSGPAPGGCAAEDIPHGVQRECAQDPREIKLFLEGSELRDHTTLAEAKVENADTLAMTYALEGEAPCWSIGTAVVLCMTIFIAAGEGALKFEGIDITSHDEPGGGT